MKQFKVKIDFLNYFVTFVELDKEFTELEFIKKFKIRCDDFPEYDPELSICMSKDNFAYIAYHPKSKLPIIVHEITHSVDHIFERYGFEFDDTELRAYLIEYIFSQFLCKK